MKNAGEKFVSSVLTFTFLVVVLGVVFLYAYKWNDGWLNYLWAERLAFFLTGILYAGIAYSVIKSNKGG